MKWAVKNWNQQFYAVYSIYTNCAMQSSNICIYKCFISSSKSTVAWKTTYLFIMLNWINNFLFSWRKCCSKQHSGHNKWEKNLNYWSSMRYFVDFINSPRYSIISTLQGLTDEQNKTKQNSIMNTYVVFNSTVNKNSREWR